jgi:ABC-type multidrug transport system fused ATPase/permease subunit
MKLTTLIKKTLPYIKPYSWKIAATVALTLVGAFIAQINAVVLDGTVDAISNMVTGDSLQWHRIVTISGTISIILLLKEVFWSFITYHQHYFGMKIRIDVSRDLSQAAIDHLLRYRKSFFLNPDNEVGKIQTRVDQGVSNLSFTIQNFFIDMLPLLMSAVLALGLMFAANFYIGLLALAIVPVYVWITKVQVKKLQGTRSNMRKNHESKNQGLVGMIQDLNVIKSYNREQFESEKHWGMQTSFNENQLNIRKTSFFFGGLKSFIRQTGTVLIIILTTYLILIDYPGMTIGKIMFNIMLFSNVTAPISQLQRIFDQMNDALIYAEGFFDILEAKDEFEPTGNYRPKKIKGDFELSGVNFTYPFGAKALENIDMHIESGKTTAFVGLSGAGKTSVINLLVKFFEPETGTIKLDGVDLKEYDTKFLRENIGVVFQENHIFNGTIADNIRYGNPSATDEEVEEAARKAFLYDQVMMLPDGFASMAQKLSGGQKQRIAIARMFLKNPPIIILDEPTASLDAVATEQIKDSIDAIKENRTVIFISHNISQIINSDMIYAMKEGKVDQSGPSLELYRQGGTYKDLVDATARSLNIDKLAYTIDLVEYLL